MKKVTPRPASANTNEPSSAKTAVVKAARKIMGYPALATGKATWLGGSGQENFFI